MVIATLRDGMYDFVLLLHLVAVVVGFGGVLLNGLYGAQAKQRPGPGGLAITEANLWVSEIAEKVLYTVPVWGIALVFMSDSAWEFSQTWIILALILYAIGLANALLVLVPTQKRMIEMMKAGPPDPAKMEAAGKRLAMHGAFSHLLFTALMVIMIWKPGL